MISDSGVRWVSLGDKKCPIGTHMISPPGNHLRCKPRVGGAPQKMLNGPGVLRGRCGLTQWRNNLLDMENGSSLASVKYAAEILALYCPLGPSPGLPRGCP